MSWLGLDVLGIWILRKLFAVLVRTNILPKKLNSLDIDWDKPVIYALQDNSGADVAVLEQECINLKLPRPMQSPNHGSLSENRAYFSLKRWDGQTPKPKPSKKRTPRLFRLVDAVERDEELDVQIVPVSIFWGRSPDKERSIWKLFFADSWGEPNLLRKIFMVLIHGRQTYVQFNDPISLRQVVDEGVDHEQTVRKVARVLRVHFRRQREAIVGPDLSHRRTLLNNLLKQPAVREAIENEVKTKNTSVKKAEKMAREYANEIAADYSHPVIQVYKVVLTWLWNQLYDGVNVHNAGQLRSLARDYEVIYVPCHRSHIDYLLLSYVLYFEGLVPPHIAAGVNLNLPVLGTILRRGGAFFLRRSFNNKLYSAVFSEYLNTVLSKGFAIEYFIEGGRSRTGRTLQPRTGMISMTVRSYLQNKKRPIAFVPIHFGYEKVFEGSTYVGELKGKAKKKESLFGLASSLKKIRRNFGKVSANFGEPIYLDDRLDQAYPNWRQESFGSEYKSPWFTDLVSNLGVDIVTNINKATTLNPINLAALVLLSTPNHSIDERTLRRQLDFYLKLQKKVPYSKSIAMDQLTPPDIIQYAEQMELISRQKHDLGDILYLEEDNAVMLTFFRNNILHLYALPGLIASFVINDQAITVERIIRFCRLIYPFVQSELFLPWHGKELDRAIRQIVESMLEANILVKREHSPLVEVPSSTSQEYVQLTILANSVKHSLERYYMTAALLLKHGPGQLDQSELENLCHLMAQRLSLLHEFNAPEFFDKSLFKNFIQNLKKSGLVWSDDEGHLVYDDRIVEFTTESWHLLGSDIRLTIRQVTESEEADRGEVVRIA